MQLSTLGTQRGIILNWKRKKDNDPTGVGGISRGEIATVITASVIGLVIVITAVIYGKIIFDPIKFDQITISGSIDIGIFAKYLDQLFTASLILLGITAKVVMDKRNNVLPTPPVTPAKEEKSDL